MDSNTNINEKIEIKYRNHSKLNYILLYDRIQDFIWNSVYSNDLNMYKENLKRRNNEIYNIPVPLLPNFSRRREFVTHG